MSRLGRWGATPELLDTISRLTRKAIVNRAVIKGADEEEAEQTVFERVEIEGEPLEMTAAEEVLFIEYAIDEGVLLEPPSMIPKPGDTDVVVEGWRWIPAT